MKPISDTAFNYHYQIMISITLAARNSLNNVSLRLPNRLRDTERRDYYLVANYPYKPFLTNLTNIAYRLRSKSITVINSTLFNEQ